LTGTKSIAIIDIIGILSITIYDMTISSTQFQQNVGYYLKLAEAGTPITISKSKPTQSRYQLINIPLDQQSISKTKLKKFLEKTDSHKALFKCYGSDSLKYVNEVRE
jgi:hypothetical protein